MIDLAKLDLIGISGKQYAGKDSLAAMIIGQCPRFCKIPLALAIKQAYAQEQGVSLEGIDANKASHRPGLIAKGNWGRDQDPDYWIKQVFLAPGPKIVSDVRLKREYDLLRQSGAFLIRVNADRSERLKRGRLVSEEDRTECELDGITDWDLVVENNQTLERLQENFLKALR